MSASCVTIATSRCLLFLRRINHTARATINTPARAAPTPIPAAVPVLSDEFDLPTTSVSVVDDAADVDVVAEEDIREDEDPNVLDMLAVLDVLDEVGVDVGVKSSIAIVDCKSDSGAGASNVEFTEVEHDVSPSLQHAHKSSVVLY